MRRPTLWLKLYILKIKYAKSMLRTTKILKDSHAVGKSVLITVIIVVLVVCLTAGFIAYQFRPTAQVSNINPTPTPIPTLSTPT